MDSEPACVYAFFFNLTWIPSQLAYILINLINFKINNHVIIYDQIYSILFCNAKEREIRGWIVARGLCLSGLDCLWKLGFGSWAPLLPTNSQICSHNSQQLIFCHVKDWRPAAIEMEKEFLIKKLCRSLKYFLFKNILIKYFLS